MIDWISTKVAMTLAALVLLAGVVAFFLGQQQEARHDALQSIADRTAGILDEVSRIRGEMNITLSLGPGGTQELPQQAGGERYSLALYPSYVAAGFDGERAFAVLRTPVHLWEPRAGTYTAASVADLDTRHPSLMISVGGSVVVSRRSLTVDGSPSLETFVFL